MIYENLIQQYNELSDEEKNALLIYKSRIGRAINALNRDEKEILDVYNRYKELLSNPKNLFVQYTIFKNVSFSNLENFKKSLSDVLELVIQATKKIVLPENVMVYRAISVERNKYTFLSKGDLVSTSLDVNKCDPFFQMDQNQNYDHYLYQIHLDKFSNVAICPYALMYDELKNQLFLSQKYDQQEIILVKDDFIFSEMAQEEVEVKDHKKIHVITMKAMVKEKNNFEGKNIK